MMTREIMVHSFVKVLCSHKRHALQGYVVMTCVYENGSRKNIRIQRYLSDLILDWIKHLTRT